MKKHLTLKKISITLLALIAAGVGYTMYTAKTAHTEVAPTSDEIAYNDTTDARGQAQGGMNFGFSGNGHSDSRHEGSSRYDDRGYNHGQSSGNMSFSFGGSANGQAQGNGNNY